MTADTTSDFLLEVPVGTLAAFAFDPIAHELPVLLLLPHPCEGWTPHAGTLASLGGLQVAQLRLLRCAALGAPVPELVLVDATGQICLRVRPITRCNPMARRFLDAVRRAWDCACGMTTAEA